jgi:predicted  nucleic acid-binding Zn-ribbon protein
MASADTRAAAEAATNRATVLADRRATIEQEIEDKQAEIVQLRINAARAGTPVGDAAVTEKAELDALLAERDTLPERHFAAQEEAAALFVQAETELINETLPQITQAQADLTPLEVAAANAEAARVAQAARLSELRGVSSIAEERRRRNEKHMEAVERVGVQPLP